MPVCAHRFQVCVFFSGCLCAHTLHWHRFLYFSSVPVLGWPGQWAVFWVAGLAWKFEMGMGLREEDPTVAVVAHLGIETSI